VSGLVNAGKIVVVIAVLILVLDYLGIEILPLLSTWQLYAIIFLYLSWRLVRAVELMKRDFDGD